MFIYFNDTNNIKKKYHPNSYLCNDINNNHIYRLNGHFDFGLSTSLSKSSFTQD